MSDDAHDEEHEEAQDGSDARADDSRSRDDAEPVTEWARDSLNSFRAVQRQLAGNDFAAINAAQRAVAGISAAQVAPITEAQRAVTEGVARSIDFAALDRSTKDRETGFVFGYLTRALAHVGGGVVLGRALFWMRTPDATASWPLRPAIRPQTPR